MPNTTAPFKLLPDNVELWTTNSPIYFVTPGNPNQAARIPFGDASSGLQAVIQSGWDLTAQVVCLVLVPTPGGNCGAGEFTSVVGSPALWIRN